jgi:hypothetical protein
MEKMLAGATAVGWLREAARVVLGKMAFGSLAHVRLG